ncbi:NUDIX domain-containing protein [Rhizobium sp. NPDC090279]|uniref:NUDIX domain-containing protein n=1 Tax=Rhizobium sp. NPDC090279 TaxID=3364499 RepID=UPI00383A1235
MIFSVSDSGISNSQERLLLQQEASGKGYTLPAGAIELGERPERAITREGNLGLRSRPMRSDTRIYIKADLTN